MIVVAENAKNDHALTNEFINILNAFPCSYNGCNYELGSNCNKIYYFHITIAVGKILYRDKWDNLHFYNQTYDLSLSLLCSLL